MVDQRLHRREWEKILEGIIEELISKKLEDGQTWGFDRTEVARKELEILANLWLSNISSWNDKI